VKEIVWMDQRRGLAGGTLAVLDIVTQLLEARIVKGVLEVEVLTERSYLRDQQYVHLSWNASAPTDVFFVQSASYLSANTDDDDISAFVQDIDSRKPLRAVGQESRLSPRSALDASRRGRDVLVTVDTAGLTGSRQPMLTSASAVDEKLREMNEAFFASLAGLSHGPIVEGRGRPHERIRSDSMGVQRGVVTPDPEDPGMIMMGRGVRPRYGSMGSVRSGVSIASEEVIGKLELDDKRSRGM
jgi:hypothetical protein